jgi:glucan 1,3-beta-glucosidase
MYERSFISPTVPAVFLVLTAAVIAAAWAWLGATVPMPAAPLSAGEKLQCVSYAPFRAEQNPLSDGTHIEAWQIDEDFARLKAVTNCVRSYSIEHGLDQIPEIARKHGLKVIHGLWLSSNAAKNETGIQTTIALAKKYPDVIQAIVVGNEVLLRGEISVQDLTSIIRRVKAQVGLPVTYADVWEFWLRHRELYDAVDFVTIHILPYWEDFPIPAAHAAAHVDAIRRQVAAAFPHKDILIGETGWPSAGRMREGALPSLSNQALVIQEVLALAKRDKFRVNVIEAFDQPWKRRLEGTVGGFWGLFDADTREAKFPWGAPVADHPHWLRQAAGGILLAVVVFAAAGLARRRGMVTQASPLAWSAVALNAVAVGIFVGLALEKVPVESLGIGGWMRSLALLFLAVALPVAASVAIMRDVAIPSLAQVLSRIKPDLRLQSILGWLTIALVVLAIQVAFGLVFDPRYKDFPFAPLTAAIVPLVTLSLAVPSFGGQRGTAEITAAAALALSALYIVFNETFANWQSVWLCGLFAALAIVLSRPRNVPRDVLGGEAGPD